MIIESLNINASLVLLNLSCLKHDNIVDSFHFLMICILLDNNIGCTCVTALNESLKTNTTLKTLDLSGKVIQIFMSTIMNKYFTTIITNITGNWIGNTGAASLSELLKKNTTLTALYLCSEHKRILTEMISTLIFSLNVIETTGNRIEDTGVTALSDSLKVNTSLTMLNLNRMYEKKNNTNWITNFSLISSNIMEQRVAFEGEQ